MKKSTGKTRAGSSAPWKFCDSAENHFPPNARSGGLRPPTSTRKHRLVSVYAGSGATCSRGLTRGWRPCLEAGRELLQRGLAENQNAMQAIGYRQVVGQLRGERSPAETVELTKIRTRQ